MFQLRVKQLREEKGISQAKLAQDIGVTYGAVGNWESGTREPKFETVIKIADYFGVSIDYLLGRTDDPNMASDVIVSTADGKITSLEDAGLAREDLDRISGVIEDIRKKYSSSTTDEVHEDEPSVLAAHADGITEEEMQEDIKKMKDYMRRKNDRV